MILWKICLGFGKNDALVFLLLDVVLIIITILSRKKKKDFKAWMCLYVIMLLWSAYTSYPYVGDIVKKETHTITGTVEKETDWRHTKLLGEIYSYKIVGEEGKEVTVKVTESCLEDFGLKEGENYTIEYFERSKAVKNVYDE